MKGTDEVRNALGVMSLYLNWEAKLTGEGSSKDIIRQPTRQKMSSEHYANTRSKLTIHR